MNDIDREFQEYMAQRTKFAVDRAKKDNLIDMDRAFLNLLQAQWARDFWVNKCVGQEVRV
jgi:hypothetical protein